MSDTRESLLKEAKARFLQAHIGEAALATVEERAMFARYGL